MSSQIKPPQIHADEKSEQIVRSWIEKNIGGTVIAMCRQGRWRPAWFVDVDMGGRTKFLYVRGARFHDHLPYSLDREFAIHRLLEQGGVKVAHVYGYIPEIPVVVMDKVAGRHDLRHAVSEEDRESIRRQLVQQMVRMHNLDTEPFRKAGLRYPGTPVETTLSFFDDIYNFNKPRKKFPNPRLEFLARWIRRNAPPANTAPRFTACDSGQFMYDGSELTAMMDFELAILGDPMQDLATLRRRTTYEPLGDIPSLFRMYEKESGQKIDHDAVLFHTVIASTAAAMSGFMFMTYYLSALTNDGDYVQFSSWFSNSTKQAFEGLAELKKCVLPELKVPEPIVTAANDALLSARATINGLNLDDPFRVYQQRALIDTVAYLERTAAYGSQLANDYLDDAAKVLGKRPRDILDADTQLERYIQQADSDDDEHLIRMFYTDSLRRCFLLDIPGSAYSAGFKNRLAPLTRNLEQELPSTTTP